MLATKEVDLAKGGRCWGLAKNGEAVDGGSSKKMERQ